MKLLANVILILCLTSLSGCVFFKNLTQGSSTSHTGYQSLQTFELEGALIYYKDLSDPCDDATVAWNDLKEVTPIKKASLTAVQIDCDDFVKDDQHVAVKQFEIQQQFSIPFEIRKTELLENGNAKLLNSMNGLATENTLFQIHGAAGTIGKRSEALGLERASAVRDHLMKLGVRAERITIMPYDPKIPGLQALVKVLAPVIL